MLEHAAKMAHALRRAMAAALPLRLNGADLLADASGALVRPVQRTLVMAAPHFEKGTSFARLGPLPPRDTRATLDRLEAAVAITACGGLDAVSGTAPMGQWTL